MDKKFKLDESTMLKILMFFLIIVCFWIVFINDSLINSINKSNEKLSDIEVLGLWQDQTDGQRIIRIRVEDRQINEILQTMKHEMAHEIYYRVAEVYNQEDSETFAQYCEKNFDECISSYNKKINKLLGAKDE